MSTYGFKSWFSYWIWRFKNRKREIKIEEELHWDYWNGKKLLMATIMVYGYKDPYDEFRRIKRRRK